MAHAFCAVAERPAGAKRATNVCVALCVKTPVFCLRLHDGWCAKDTCGPLPAGESPALAFLSVIRPERSRMGGNLLLFSHRATTPPWQGPEGQGFNPANNTRTKAHTSLLSLTAPQICHPERSSSRTLRATQSKDPEDSYGISTVCPFSPYTSVASGSAIKLALAPCNHSTMARTGRAGFQPCQ